MAADAFAAPPGGLARFRRRLATEPWSALLELGCRAGYVARGLVYLSIGAVALLAALGRTPGPEGPQGALVDAWARWPAGLALLWFTGLGLYGFAAWRALQSLLDADRQGRSPKAIVSRAGQAISGVVHVALAISVFGVLDALEDLREPEDEEGARRAASALMDLSYGSWLVIGVGAFILAVGVAGVLQGLFRDFCQGLACRGRTARWVGMLGKAGYAARGIAFVVAGGFTVKAGLDARASDAKGLGGALEVLARQPYGSEMLALLALGLVAFGLYAWAESRWRPMRPAEAIRTAA